MAGVSQRIESMSESATMAITAKAKALRAAGHQVIGYGAGEPDFPTPDPIVAAAIEAAADPAMHRYTPAAGLPALREAVAAKSLRHSGLEVDASQVMITNGGKHAVYTAIHCLIDPGDEVLLPAPFWVTYPAVVDLADGVTVPIETDADHGFKVTVEQLENALTSRTKMLIFVSPSNPTGAVYTVEEVAAIGSWAADRGIWVLTDEIYEHLVYGDAAFASLPVEVPELAERCVVVNGVAKTYAMTGWRVGWMIGPAEVIVGATKLQGHLTSNVCNIAQAGAIAARVGAPRRCVHDERGVRPAQTNHAPDAQRDERHRLHRTGRSFLLLRVRTGGTGPPCGRCPARHCTGTGRRLPRSGRSGLRARRGIRGPGLRPLLLCTR